MESTLEEILEAVWVAGESGEATEPRVRELCPDPVLDADLETLANRSLVLREGGELLLTRDGLAAARRIVRRHRLADTLLATILQIEPDRRRTIACETEHTLLPEMEEGICTLLGHPTETPEGRPIPPGRCCVRKQQSVGSMVCGLTALRPGERGRIAYIRPKSHARLHRLASFGIIPGAIVELHQRSPAFCIKLEETELAVERDVAEDIYVSKLDDRR